MAEGEKKRLAEMNSVHTIQVNIKEYNTALTVQDMPFILENLDTGSIFQTKPFEIPLEKEPNAPVAIGMIGFYTVYALLYYQYLTIFIYRAGVLLLSMYGVVP